MNALGDRLMTTARGVGVLAWVGFGIGAGFLGLAALMVAGSAVSDPGGWRGIGFAVALLLVMGALAVLALLRPAPALPVLTVLTLLPVGFGVWSLVAYDSARDWENNNGPISLVFLVVVAAGLIVLGLTRPREAGVLLLIATVAPAVLAMIGAGSEWFMPLSIALVSLPLVIAGVLYLAAGASAARSRASHERPSVVV